MDIPSVFNRFLEDKVNLNPQRVTRIKDAQRVLSEFIQSRTSFKEIYIDAIAQGSYRQKTIIRPVGDDGTFDVDLLIILRRQNGWEPKDYLNKLASEFRAVGKYEEITDTTGKTRCVTIDYEGDFHADLVPAVFDKGVYFICNKETNEFEQTDGDGYAEWFKNQDNITGGNLVPAVRLIKYLRDYKDEFDTKSIILTTIAGIQINHVDAISALYKDVPTMLATLLSRTHQFISQFQSPPSIANPAMPGENFDRHWKKEKKGFVAFKTAIKEYSDLAQQAISSTDQTLQLQIWQKLFGESFDIDDKNAAKVISDPYGGSGAGVSFSPQKPWSD